MIHLEWCPSLYVGLSPSVLKLCFTLQPYYPPEKPLWFNNGGYTIRWEWKILGGMENEEYRNSRRN